MCRVERGKCYTGGPFRRDGQRLKRVFAIDIEKCEKCGGPVQIIVSIEDPDVIQKILKHLGLDQPVDTPIRSPPSVLTDHSMTLF